MASSAAVAPVNDYPRPVRSRERPETWRLDVGACERCGIDWQNDACVTFIAAESSGRQVRVLVSCSL